VGKAPKVSSYSFSIGSYVFLYYSAVMPNENKKGSPILADLFD